MEIPQTQPQTPLTPTPQTQRHNGPGKPTNAVWTPQLCKAGTPVTWHPRPTEQGLRRLWGVYHSRLFGRAACPTMIYHALSG